MQHYRGQQRLRERAGQRVTLSDREAPLVCPEYILPDLLYHLPGEGAGLGQGAAAAGQFWMSSR